jgi:lipoate-protein ligase A
VLQGPGILNAALAVPGTGRFTQARELMGRLARALARALSDLGTTACAEGAGDVRECAPPQRKLAGLAARARGGGVLAHASILAGPDVGLIERVLKHPRREPDYRRKRSHREFLGSVPALEDGSCREAFARALNRALNS